MSELKYIRDDTSKAILNTDLTALEQYRKKKEQKLQEQNIIQNCVTDINILKDDMTEIKNLLIKLSEN